MAGRWADYRVMGRLRLANRGAQILLALTLAVGLNLIAASHFTRTDITPQRQFALSPESQAYLDQLKEPVNIIVTVTPEADPLIFSDIERLLKEYRYASRRNGDPLITIEYVDVFRQRRRARQLVSEYGIQGENAIVVASGDRRREINGIDLYDQAEGDVKAFKGEQAFTTAIIEVTRPEPETIYFLVGHGEPGLDDVDPARGLSRLRSALREQSFAVETLDLSLAAAVPEDADLVVVAGPQAPLQAFEEEKLRLYLSDRNGRVLIFLDPYRQHGLDRLLYDWGILADDRVVLDEGPNYRASGGDLTIRHFARHPITQTLIDFQLPVLMGLPRPVRRDPGAPLDSSLTILELLGSAPGSWAETNYRTEQPPTYDPEVDLAGPIALATLAEREVGAPLGIRIAGGRVVAFGNVDFITNNRFETLGNRTLFMNSVNWLLDRDYLLNIPPKPLETIKLVISESDLTRLLLALLSVPVGVAALGLIVTWTRRR
ncbi:MAG: GldG family protein [Opitutales bacterium]